MVRSASARLIRLGVALAVATSLLISTASLALAGQDKVTICHAAGRAAPNGPTQYIEITVGWPAAFGPAGHFDENGTPNAGHEEDFLGGCGCGCGGGGGGEGG
jgi:hypothetical protein